MAGGPPELARHWPAVRVNRAFPRPPLPGAPLAAAARPRLRARLPSLPLPRPSHRSSRSRENGAARCRFGSSGKMAVAPPPPGGAPRRCHGDSRPREVLRPQPPLRQRSPRAGSRRSAWLVPASGVPGHLPSSALLPRCCHCPGRRWRGRGSPAPAARAGTRRGRALPAFPVPGSPTGKRRFSGGSAPCLALGVLRRRWPQVAATSGLPVPGPARFTGWVPGWEPWPRAGAGGEVPNCV